MSDLRHDPLDDIWVAMADHRRDRPMEFVPREQLRQQIICPFCKGNESETPAAIAAYRVDGEKITSAHQQSDWLSRVVANKYPSYTTPGSEPLVPRWKLDFKGQNEAEHRLPFRVDDAHGVQELIIPSPRHVTTLSQLTDAELELSFQVHADRLQVLYDADDIEHGMLFLNCRSAAGASLGHLHWQLIGSPVISGMLQSRVYRQDQHRQETGRSLLQSLTEWEIEQGARVLRLTDQFCIVCPFAGRFPFQIQIIPHDLSTSFIQCGAAIRTELAKHCRDVVQRLESLLDHPAYNVLLHVPPFNRFDQPWYLEIFPRLTITAGYEWGTGVWVNPVAPETAARAMKVAPENRSV